MAPNSEGLLYALDNPDDDTVIVDTATIATFAVADLYTVSAALPPRWRARASWMLNLSQLNRIRQFDTAGGANLWVQLGEGNPDRLLGKPVYENSAMDSGWLRTRRSRCTATSRSTSSSTGSACRSR
ncbi:MAG: phage major capsid protein [Acidimicrobiia bacterium]|nr:phage major capsid protein [Acidimicrobiia bacterium]